MESGWYQSSQITHQLLTFVQPEDTIRTTKKVAELYKLRALPVFRQTRNQFYLEMARKEAHDSECIHHRHVMDAVSLCIPFLHKYPHKIHIKFAHVCTTLHYL